jgi:hypothetical protein
MSSSGSTGATNGRTGKARDPSVRQPKGSRGRRVLMAGTAESVPLQSLK